MDDEGKMSVNRIHEIIHKYLDDDPATMKKAIDFTNACSSVNDATVNDGAKGCDRAALMFQCSVEKSEEGVTDEEVKSNFVRALMQCTKDNPVDMKELFQLKKLIVPKNRPVKCLLACTYKKMKSFTDKGMYDVEQGYRMAELSKNGDEKRLENGRKLVDICSKVNDMQVSDGDKGCDRAALFFKCLVENAPKFGFKV
ncbi:uncharacterized protein [Battus philenor]|uniref:uncharacterized protein n=1 Tax=Battus philenor TaxID=42288 RepID=UPI0035CF78CB